MDWLQDVIREYVAKNEIRTTEENMQRLKDYYISQGYDSLYVVCNALIADRKTIEILTGYY